MRGVPGNVVETPEEEGKVTWSCVGRTHSDPGSGSSQEVAWGTVLTSVGRGHSQVSGSRGKTEEISLGNLQLLLLLLQHHHHH